MTTAYAQLLVENKQLVLLYLQNAQLPRPAGFTTREVMAGAGLGERVARRVLERLYVHKQVARQKALMGADQASYWLPVPPGESLDLRGPSDKPVTPPTLCVTCRQPTGGGRMCRSCAQINGAIWDELDENELAVMVLIETFGLSGMPFSKTRAFGGDAIRALQSLQRQGIAGVDLRHEVWRLGPKGETVCAAWKKHVRS